MTTEQTSVPSQLVRVCIFTGDESIGKQRVKLQIIEAIIAQHGQVTHERFDSSAESLAEFLERYITPSLFQETRIFHINHAQQLNEKDLEQLNRSLDYYVPDAFMLVDIEDEKKGKDESKATKKLKIKQRAAKSDRFAVLEFVKPPEYKLSQWLTTQVPILFDRTISKVDADYLIDLAGTEIGTIYSELQKIDIHLPPKTPILRPVIEEITGAARQMSPFELATALGSRNFVRVLQIIESLFATSFAAPIFVAAVFRHFWALFRIRKYAEKNPQEMRKYLKNNGNYANQAQNDAAFAIGLAAGLLFEGEQRKVYPIIIASGIVQQARNFSEQELKAILGWLLELDVGVKSGRIDPDRGVIQLLCYKIVRSAELVRDGVVS